jgi:amino acid transporter
MAVTTLLAAMVAMTATAVSFGRMAAVYPSAGSTYTYASRGFDARIGFVLGWAMFLEYLFQPLQNSLYAALAVVLVVSSPRLRTGGASRRGSLVVRDGPRQYPATKIIRPSRSKKRQPNL